jgi:hypothetical protein
MQPNIFLAAGATSGEASQPVFALASRHGGDTLEGSVLHEHAALLAASNFTYQRGKSSTSTAETNIWHLPFEPSYRLYLL